MGNEDPSVWEKKDRRIARMACIKAAVEYAGYHMSRTKECIDQNAVIEIAKAFEAYIYEPEG